MPNASASAKPRNRLGRCAPAADGLRIAPMRNWPNTFATPMAAAPMPMHARPAPRYFAATGSIARFPFRTVIEDESKLVELVPGVECIAEVDARENGEYVGLQERDQELERGERGRQCQRG